MERNPVIFLDIDGVLNSPSTFERLPMGVIGIDPINVAMLNRLLDYVDVEIIVSSTWRLLHTLPVIQRWLEAAGFKGRLAGRTIEIMASCNRGEEIQAWLTENPDVTQFVIFDDDNDMAHLIDHLIQTDPVVGLTVEDINKALLFLM